MDRFEIERLEKLWTEASTKERAALALLAADACEFAQADAEATEEAAKLHAVVERCGYASEYNAQSAKLRAADERTRLALAGLRSMAQAYRETKTALSAVRDEYTRGRETAQAEERKAS